MIELIAEQPIRSLIALAIGLATAWWIWAGQNVHEEEDYSQDGAFEEEAAEPVMEAEAEPELGPEAGPEAGPEEEQILELAEKLDDDDPYPLAAALAAGTAGAAIASVPDNDDEGDEAQEEPAQPAIAPAVGESDDLTRINGIGPKLQALCNELGVRRFDQIAKWGDSDIAELDGFLGGFKGRIERDKWVDQAKLLALGHAAEWDAKFGYKS